MENSKAETTKQDEPRVDPIKEPTPKGGGSDSSRAATKDTANNPES